MSSVNRVVSTKDRAASMSPSTVNWQSLSDRGAWILRHVATPISEGYSIAEIALKHGLPQRKIGKMLSDLRQELRDLGE